MGKGKKELKDRGWNRGASGGYDQRALEMDILEPKTRRGTVVLYEAATRYHSIHHCFN